MADYRISGDGVIRNDGSGIPPDPENRDWAAYLAWVAAGNVADPAPVIPPDPRPTIADEALAIVAASGILTAEQMAALGGT